MALTPELAALGVVVLCWASFLALYVARKVRGSGSGAQLRDLRSWLGIAIQSVSFAAVWSLRRAGLGPFLPVHGMSARIALAAAVIVLGLASIGLCLAAALTLGRQWAFTARVLEDHRLVQEGPFRFVRHPIYAGMLGMLIATGMAVTTWWILVPACLLYCLGTWIRIRVEERLLRERFGPEFDAYVARVSAVLPGAW